MKMQNTDGTTVKVGKPTSNRSKRRCLGYPSGNGCTKVAGGKWSPYWCPECDQRRVDHISGQLAKIQGSFETTVGAPQK